MSVLEGDEKEKLSAVITEAFATFDELRIAVSACLNQDLNVIVGSEGGTRAVVFRLVVWSEKNDSLPALLQGLPKHSGDRTLSALCPQLLTAIKEREPGHAFKSVSPYEAVVVRMAQIFVDRKELRKYLKQMDQANGFRILVVSGDRGAGKSHSRYLISHVADRHRPSGISFFDSAHSQSRRVEPDDLIRSLALQLGFPVSSIPDQVSKSERWVLELAEWLTGEINRADKPCWIILDGFDDPAVPTPTGELIQHLARLAHTHSLLRIVLLHYRRDRLPLDVQRGAREDLIPTVSQLDLHEFFMHIFEQRGDGPKNGAPAQLAALVWAEVQPYANKPEFMSVLADKILEHLRELFPGEF